MSCSSSDPPTFCSDAPDLKLYQVFIFSVPVMFTFVLLLLFYLFYLRRRRANWASLRMRASYLARGEMPRLSESGIKKEVREMLPVVVFGESFLIRETQCSVCLGDYKSDEWLKRIPPCGHTFHVDCIDHWLTTHTTCPLCRVSLVPATKPTDPLNLEGQAIVLGNTAIEGDTQVEEHAERNGDGRLVPHGNGTEERERSYRNEELVCTRRWAEESRCNGDGSVVIDLQYHATAEGSLTV